MVRNESYGMWSSGEAGSVKEGFWSPFQPELAGGMCAHVDREVLYYYEHGSWSLANCKESLPFVCQTSGCPEGNYSRVHEGSSRPDDLFSQTLLKSS